jgi:hypothetical protein
MLSELQGSPKQIAWALKIRTDGMNCWKKSDPIVFKRVEQTLENETSASWWITYREKELVEVLTYIQGESTGKALVKPKASPLPSPSIMMTYVPTSDDGGITRYVGELRDAVTGEVVDDPKCPF